MFCAYVIQSIASHNFYKGHCENLEARLIQHNSGKVKTTKSFKPWKFIYFEKFETRAQAIAREKYFKTGAGRRFLKKIIIKK